MDNQDRKDNCEPRKTDDVGGHPVFTGSAPKLIHGEWYLGHWAGDSMLAVMCYDETTLSFSERAFSEGRPMSATDYVFTPIAHMIRQNAGAVHPNTEVTCVNCGNVYSVEYTHVFGDDSDGKRVCCDCIEGLSSEDAPLISQSANVQVEFQEGSE